jgi:hypothetical protein
VVNVKTDGMHPAEVVPKIDAANLFSDKPGDFIHKQYADEVSREIPEIVEIEHGLIVALSGPIAKAGKCGYPAIRAKWHISPPLSSIARCMATTSYTRRLQPGGH